MSPAPSSTTEALSSNLQENQTKTLKRTQSNDDQDSISAKRPKYNTNQGSASFDPLDALNNSVFANIPFEIRKMIFSHALVSDEPIDENNPEITQRLSPALGDVCQLFQCEGKELYFSKNEFLFKDPKSLDESIESNSPFINLVQKIRFDSNINFGDTDLSRLSANAFWNNDDMGAILQLENLKEFTFSIQWHFGGKMFKLMERLFRHVKKVFERHGVYLEKLSIVTKPETKRKAFFIAKPPAESIRVHGSRTNGKLYRADIPIILGRQGEIFKPGDEVYDIYTRQNTYTRDLKADSVNDKFIEALNMGLGLD